MLSLLASAPAEPAGPAGPTRTLAAATGGDLPPLLREPYRLEVSVSFTSGLLHWLDCLVGAGAQGMTSGRTREAHRDQYLREFGELSPDDIDALRGYVEAREWYASQVGPENRDALTAAFFEADSLGDAIDAATGLLGDMRGVAVRQAVERFAPRYRKIWDGGRIPLAFLDLARRSEHLDDLSRFLAGVARFYGARADRKPLQRLVLVPVASGSGTHAQALGRNLLLEIRAGDSLGDQVEAIVHENAHLLFGRMDPATRDALRARALARGKDGGEAWRLLDEALPTAIAQGVAGRRYGVESWSRKAPWYDIEPIDRYSKSLYLLVRRALTDGTAFDETFLDGALAMYARPVTPRSP